MAGQWRILMARIVSTFLVSSKAIFRRTIRFQTGSTVSVPVLFMFSVIVGCVVKIGLGMFVTIGYDDYRVATIHKPLDLIELQKKTLAEGGSLAYTPKDTAAPLCSSQLDTVSSP